MKSQCECDAGVTKLAMQWQSHSVKIDEVFTLVIAMVQNTRFLSETITMMNMEERIEFITHPPTNN